MSEYVRVKPAERVYGETNLLQSQLNLITLLKQYQEYKMLRKEEIYMKIELKKQIGELNEFLDHLSKLLPESKFLEEQKEREKMKHEVIEKVDSYVQKSKKKQERSWKEKIPVRKTFIGVVNESERYEARKEKENAKEEVTEVKSGLDQELEEIRKKLAKLQ